jgi:hypothetical protein
MNHGSISFGNRHSVERPAKLVTTMNPSGPDPAKTNVGFHPIARKHSAGHCVTKETINRDNKFNAFNATNILWQKY